MWDEQRPSYFHFEHTDARVLHVHAAAQSMMGKLACVM